MSQMTDILAQLGGMQSMARELGVTESQAQSGAESLIPAILGGMKTQARAQPAGLDGLMGMLGNLGGGGLMDDVLAPQPTNVARGNDVLGQIFGSKEVSRTVAQNAAGRSGLDPSLLRKMLPLVTMLISGYLARQGGGTSATPSGDLAGGLPGGSLGDVLGGLLGQRGGSTGLASLLDMDGDANPLDDILGMAGKSGR